MALMRELSLLNMPCLGSGAGGPRCGCVGSVWVGGGVVDKGQARCVRKSQAHRRNMKEFKSQVRVRNRQT